MDVYGVGVLIMGESGIGKSEAALELVKRGHRLVSDDVVEIKKVSDETLVGSAPDITRHFIELRGIGIVDVKTLFGVLSVRETQNIDLVIPLEEWNKEKEYEDVYKRQEKSTGAADWNLGDDISPVEKIAGSRISGFRSAAGPRGRADLYRAPAGPFHQGSADRLAVWKQRAISPYRSALSVLYTGISKPGIY